VRLLTDTVVASGSGAADSTRVGILVVNTGDEIATVRHYDAERGTYLGLHWAASADADQFVDSRGFARFGPVGDLLVTARVQ
jgi:hypothetical protein